MVQKGNILTINFASVSRAKKVIVFVINKFLESKLLETYQKPDLT